MKLAIMQPYFFPYIGYWQLINSVDRFVIYDDVNYIKGGWVNRNRLLVNGEPTYATVPLDRPSPNRLICDTDLHPSLRWREKLIKTIENAYRRAPSFFEVFPVVEQIIRHDTNKLSSYLAFQIRSLAGFMGIGTEIVVNSDYSGDVNVRGQARVLDICAREQATIYINSQGGQGLYDRTAFQQYGVELKFLVPSNIQYKQFDSEYVPWLSIIDVLMFNTKSQLLELLDQYEVI